MSLPIESLSLVLALAFGFAFYNSHSEIGISLSLLTLAVAAMLVYLDHRHQYYCLSPFCIYIILHIHTMYIGIFEVNSLPFYSIFALLLLTQVE